MKKDKTKKLVAALLTFALIAGCLLAYINGLFNFSRWVANEPYKLTNYAVTDENGNAVSSTSREATAVGLNVLNNGGNAVDAAVAMAFTLSVVESYSSGLGGGGFMLVYDPADGNAYSLDYYTSSGHSEDRTGDIGVPGFLKGMQTALDNWGTRTLSEMIAPAIYYAESGFTAYDLLIRRINYTNKIDENPAYDNIQTGDNVVQPELAETLRNIQENGIEVFYSGSIGEDISSISGLSMEDLMDYQVYVESAISTVVNGYTLYGTTAPSSAITTMQIVAMANMMNIITPNVDTASYLETLRMVTMASYTDRYASVGDIRYYDFDSSTLLSESHLQEIINSQIMSGTVGTYESDPERRCTVEFSVMDSNGMMVCVTNTLSNNWGSTQMVDGFYLNNTLSLFANSGRNAYEPMKRPRTHFSPIIVLGTSTDTEGFSLAIGSPGGNNIPRIVSTILIDILLLGETPEEAIRKSRFLVDDDGFICVESSAEEYNSIDVTEIPYGFYYSDSHLYFGCTSVVGSYPGGELFAVSDSHRISGVMDSETSDFFGF